MAESGRAPMTVAGALPRLVTGRHSRPGSGSVSMGARPCLGRRSPRRVICQPLLHPRTCAVFAPPAADAAGRAGC